MPSLPDNGIRVFGRWFDNQFNLWIYTVESGFIPKVMKYVWNYDNNIYGYYYADNWSQLANHHHTDGIITVHLSEDARSVTLTVNNLLLENDSSIDGKQIIINETKTFPIWNQDSTEDGKRNASFCGLLVEFDQNDYTNYSYKPVLNVGYGAGLPIDAMSDRCLGR